MANRNVCSCLRRGQSHVNSCICISSRERTWIAATFFASLKYSAYMKLITVHCCCVLGKIRAGWSSGLLNEDLGCITSHAESTAATYSTGAVRSEDAHLIMACWAFLWHSFGAEKVLHTRWPTETSAHACEEVKAMSNLLFASPPARRHEQLLRFSPV